MRAASYCKPEIDSFEIEYRYGVLSKSRMYEKHTMFCILFDLHLWRNSAHIFLEFPLFVVEASKQPKTIRC